jgi:hypothetical protein
VRDEFNEADYSPVHFDQSLIMDLIRFTISSKRTNQAYVLLEGLCNQGKLTNPDDKLELRYMDELFDIEREVGEVVAIIGLQFQYENERVDADDVVYLDLKVAKPVKEEKKEVEGEEAPAEEEGEKKEAKFRPEEFKWTVSNKRPKNLPTLFMKLKGQENTKHEVNQAEEFSSSQYEAISNCLDDFCAKVFGIKLLDREYQYFYQQVIFAE